MRRAFHIGLAALLLLTSTGFTVERHYCMGRLVDAAVFGEPDRCPAEAFMNAQDKKGCCDDESERFELDEDRQLSGDEASIWTVAMTPAAWPTLVRSPAPPAVLRDPTQYPNPYLCAP